MDLKYVVTETREPDSFDPIDADKTQNLSVMRMLYATPLEIDKNNLLRSSILKSFFYDEQKHLINFVLEDDLTYSNGEPLTIRDVAISIARMAYFRPDFPIIKCIVGIRPWAQAKKGLQDFPTGMTIKGSTLTIQLDRKIANPLFRFCLELFAVIPESCIDLDTGALTCELAPSSGYFELEKKSASGITFRRRTENKRKFDDISFERIIFKFKSLSDACLEPIDSNQIISGSEIDFIAAGCDEQVQPNQIHWMPSSRFLILRFNPHARIFEEKRNRQFFAEKVREILRVKSANLIVENGLFPKLLPGYLKSTDLQFSTGDRSQEFRGQKILLPDVKAIGSVVFESIIEAAKKLQMNVEVVPELPMGQIMDAFLNGKFPVIAGSSGFWAQDPVGDVSMWFTRNLHKSMKFIWEDNEIYRQIHELETEADSEQIKSKMEVFNKYISEQALIAPVLHFRRLFISSPNVKGLNLPQAITSPAPWQLTVIQ